ncbi:MAG TPA: DUF983 domain-containing protein [Symbiobacteriaceae bacterium]|jgi:uncharacterized protein (DUF983 family)|nr:DUF983 domain-containing protein [Symbiobacteriaceae bacterium]
MWEMCKAAWVGLFLRCPACRQGRIYRSFTAMNEECPVCGVVFEREEGDFLGAMVVAYSITSVVIAFGVYVLIVLTDLDAMTHVVIWSVFATLFLVTTYRNMKGIWLGILHVMMGLKRRETRLECPPK